jgi:hypothetical protein
MAKTIIWLIFEGNNYMIDVSSIQVTYLVFIILIEWISIKSVSQS